MGQNASQSVNYVIPVMTGVFGMVSALVAVLVTHKAATRREENARVVAEQREARNREADQQRERSTDLRTVTDDAARALRDLWEVLAPFQSVALGSKRAVSPDVESLNEAYGRLIDAHVRLLLRVDGSDTLHSPVGFAVSRLQVALDTLRGRPLGPHTTNQRRYVSEAHSAVATGYEELQEAARKRFAPTPLPDAETVVSMLIRRKRHDQRTRELVSALQQREGRGLRRVALRDDIDSIVVVDAEADDGDAKDRLERWLDSQGDDWREHLEFAP